MTLFNKGKTRHNYANSLFKKTFKFKSQNPDILHIFFHLFYMVQKNDDKDDNNRALIDIMHKE